MTEWSKNELRVIMRYTFARGLSIDECVDEMSSVLKEDCPHRTKIYRWYREFNRGNFGVDDSPRSGCPTEVCNEENVEKVERDNRRITYRQIEEIPQISAPSIHKILHDSIGVKKVCTLWVPHDLKEEQKICRVNWCKKMLKEYENGTSNYVSNIVTGDETWLYYFDVPSKSKNKIKLFENEPTPIQVRKSRPVKKKMIAVFFTRRGILDRIVLESQRTATASWYTKECLPKVIQKLRASSKFKNG